jgi:hypothetical protein
VLHKSDPRRVQGFTAKLTDFGLSKLMSANPDDRIINNISAGALSLNMAGGLRIKNGRASGSRR